MKKKLIEVALPIEAINSASSREKSIRHGHPSTLHLWWARRPLAACRAILFAQLVDDPSARIEEIMADKSLRAQAESELPERRKAWEKSKASAQGAVATTPEPTIEDVACEIERKRLFTIIEDLVKWENSTNEEVLERARIEIRRSHDGILPPIYDPFSGGGSIPLEAQRLGLPAHGSDLNPVAVMIGKAMIEIPPKFKDKPPVHHGIKGQSFYRNAEGLAEDVRYYGDRIREKAMERIGTFYPKVTLPKEYGGGEGTVVAWIWTRTVPSPDPAHGDVQVPLVRSFKLSAKKGEVWVKPVVEASKYHFEIEVLPKGKKHNGIEGTVGRQGGICIVSNSAMPLNYIREQGRKGKMGHRLMAIVVEGRGGRIFLPPDAVHETIAVSAEPTWRPDVPLPKNPRDFKTPNYGIENFGDVFSKRQLLALQVFSETAIEVQELVKKHAVDAGLVDDGIPLRGGGTGALAYAEAISVYLGSGPINFRSTFLVESGVSDW